MRAILTEGRLGAGPARVGGTAWPIDRTATAEYLGFTRPVRNADRLVELLRTHAGERRIGASFPGTEAYSLVRTSTDGLTIDGPQGRCSSVTVSAVASTT